MDEFSGRVAVITGAASGIGRGMAGRFAEAGMRLVLADIEREPLAIAERELIESGAEVLAVRTDVSDLASVELLAEAAYERFGAVHVLCNNAGVTDGGGGGQGIWTASANDWKWTLGVNLMGAVHGLQAFVPRMIEGGEPGHIVNTSSVLGLSTGPGSVYGVSKHAVTRLTEGLHHDLLNSGAPLGASVLCPGMIATHIISAERNRPSELRDEQAADDELSAMREQMESRFLAEGMPPDEVGAIVLEAIRDERFYILTHPQIKERVEVRMRDILEDRPPTPPPAFGPAG